ncbi:hypothetical protein M4I32_03425 [Microbacterium sp. LRZ72]|uniref:hypothetical protein n=1 Tax=Microbacterium sp. LRZ72 TaxID=2942481 RepID=UPI0029BA98CC|nr:hypothetical protein [Microbacterium sp. LRZ72]MDX2375846.1 hypothetical protein [Microbacterium sp. LRZ72]
MSDAASQPAADGLGGTHERWIVFVRATDRSGALTALAETFSSRGISFEAFHTLTVQEGYGDMSIIFRGSERLARVLTRTIERLTMICSVVLERTSEPGLRAVAVVREPAEGSVVLTGSLRDVEAEVASARAAGAGLEAIVVLPPER